MARTQRIALADQPDTYTVLGADRLPIAAAEEFLQFLRDDTASPNTVKAYAARLAAWWTLLEHTRTDWREISTAMFGQFLAYLRTGDLPGTARIGAPPTWLGPASTQLRAAAVLACYRYHADAHGLAGPYQRLFTSRGARGRSRYIPMLAGVGPPRPKDRPVYRVRRGNLAATPVLLHDPLISTDPDELRAAFLDYLDYLRSPDAATQSERLTAYTVASLQSETQSSYTFMHDHAAEAATATGNPRWREATLTRTALWSPIRAPRHRRRERDLTWYSTADLQRMLAYLDVLAADPKQKVVLTRPDGTVAVVPGLGDPQAARIWLLQALTGRRASEILMLDYDPLEAIPGHDRPTQTSGEPDSGAFVARLRYQQTKVDGVVPTILAEQAIVDIISEQQAWLAATYPALQPKYLFLGIKNQHRGQRPRSYTTYRAMLDKLDGCHDLTDSAGHRLKFTQTHRLRHTRATELLNDGVPFHVVCSATSSTRVPK